MVQKKQEQQSSLDSLKRWWFLIPFTVAVAGSLISLYINFVMAQDRISRLEKQMEKVNTFVEDQKLRNVRMDTYWKYKASSKQTAIEPQTAKDNGLQKPD